MSGNRRAQTPTYHFGDTSDHAFTFGDGWIENQSISSEASPSNESRQHGQSSVNEQLDNQTYNFGNTSNHSFTFADGWVQSIENSSPSIPADRQHSENLAQDNQDSSSNFSFRDLRNALPSPGGSTLLSTSNQPLPTEPTAISADSISNSRRDQATASASQGTRLRNTSTTSVGSSNTAAVEGYDIRQERYPAHAFFSSEFQSNLRKGIEIARRTVVAIDKYDTSGNSSSSLTCLLDDARKLCVFQASDTRTIAVLGDSGEGSFMPSPQYDESPSNK
jgi:hypothetical protein